jgi:hypothetical protein
MTVLVVLGLLFVVAGVAGIAGWGVDSRDSRFSLWPLYRAAPNEFRRRDPRRPDVARRRAGGSAAPPQRRDAARVRVPRSATGRRPVHVAHRTAKRRHVTGRAVTPAKPQAPASRADVR